MNDGRGQEEQEEYVRRVLEAYRQTRGPWERSAERTGW
jgi:hypothetical protein